MKASLILIICVTFTVGLPATRHHHSALYRLFHAPGQDLFVRGYVGNEENQEKNQAVSSRWNFFDGNNQETLHFQNGDDDNWSMAEEMLDELLNDPTSKRHVQQSDSAISSENNDHLYFQK